ncbi:hypothetical protein C8R41DRAFT_442217 [Lentinula lateritia]|uniref:DUF6593 domain-containing protein n=1 Tax=Lentinula lateritia TaxID=40482 RepID=A0ABQ8VBB7_9AGAR|nr:hypothetical protein C8R41DRAFT_442217 [Lentinula lateritia]
MRALKSTNVDLISTETNETLKPPIQNIQPSISRSTSRTPSESRVPPPVHPSIHYGSESPVTPPGYAATTKPTESITYIFEPRPAENAMLLRPAETGGREARHPYYISVTLNCFTPSSHITSIRKYERQGELVGDFEIAAKESKNVSTVYFRGYENPIEEVLVPRLFRNQWTWKPTETHFVLYWDDSAGGNSIACFKSKDKTNTNLLAKFIPRSHMRKPGREIEYTKFEVTPAGHEVFDDILISALIIERLRTNA